MQHFIFDLDGTISNPEKGIFNAYKYAFRQLELPIPEDKELHQYIGPPLRTVFGEYFGLNETKTEYAITSYRQYYIEQKGMFENDLFEGMLELLHVLKSQQKTLHIATFKGASVDTILNHFNILPFFDCIEFYNETTGIVTKEKMIQNIMGVSGIQNLQEVIMIGDRKHDISAAHQCGVASCGVLYGFGNKEEMDICKPTYTAYSVKELHKILTSL